MHMPKECVYTSLVSLLEHSLSSGHLHSANYGPLVGIQSLSLTEMKVNNVVPIIKGKTVCGYLFHCLPFYVNFHLHIRERGNCQIVQKNIQWISWYLLRYLEESERAK